MRVVTYGTDEQCIHLTTKAGLGYTIRYCTSDGTLITEATYNTRKPAYTYKCDIIVNGYVTKGWDIGGTKIGNEQLIKLDVTYDGQIFTAVPYLEKYIFDYNNSTVLTLCPTGDEMYVDGQMISSQTIIDYDSVIDSLMKIKSNQSTIKISKVHAIDNQNIVVDWDYDLIRD